VSEAAQATFESRDFFATGGVRLYGLTLFHELMSVERAGIGLALPADLSPQKSYDRRLRSKPHGARSARSPAGLWTASSAARQSSTSVEVHQVSHLSLGVDSRRRRD
jgi:hypothetical protein